MPEPARRGRGTRAGLDLDAIIAAARGMEPAQVTMQSVAGVLGVDRKALNHHVRDRESLLELLAVDALRRAVESGPADQGQTWQDACRGFAQSLRRAIMACGPWLPYFRFTSPCDLVIARPAEVLAERLLASGMDADTASRTLHLLVTTCNGFACNAATVARQGGAPHLDVLRTSLAETTQGYAALAALVDAQVDHTGDDQFRFDVECVIAAIESRMPALV